MEKAGEDYAPGQEIFITYKGGNARTQDILWVFEYGMVIPGNEHSEFVLTIKLDTNLYPKMAEVVDAANVAGLSTGKWILPLLPSPFSPVAFMVLKLAHACLCI